jgi:succinate dehydrogenase hydrophobic anchor subunit
MSNTPKLDWLSTRGAAIAVVMVLDVVFLFLFWLPWTPAAVRPVLKDAFLGANTALFLALSLRGPVNPNPPGS